MAAPLSDATSAQLRLAKVLLLGRRARAATAEELPFVLVNETRQVVDYTFAALWTPPSGLALKGHIVSVSGTITPDADAPMIVWLTSLCAHLAQRAPIEPTYAFTAPQLKDQAPDLASDWGEWIPRHALWLPLTGRDGALLGGLIVGRPSDWTAADTGILSELADVYAHAYNAYAARQVLRPWHSGWWNSRRKLASAIAAIVLALVPVRQSTIAPAEVVPREPTLVRAPLEGVVGQVAVRSNDLVAQDQTLFTLDQTQLLSRLAVAEREYDIASAELQQTQQAAMDSSEAKAKLAVVEGRRQQQDAELIYVQDLLRRTTVTAPHAGVVVFEDDREWVGRPVALGQSVLMLADPAKFVVEIRLPVADAGPYDVGSDVAFFRGVNPMAPIGAVVERFSFAASPSTDGTVSYRLLAKVEDGADLKIGTRGSARVYGPRQPLIVALLRRPLGTLRLWLTF